MAISMHGVRSFYETGDATSDHSFAMERQFDLGIDWVFCSVHWIQQPDDDFNRRCQCRANYEALRHIDAENRFAQCGRC